MAKPKDKQLEELVKNSQFRDVVTFVSSEKHPVVSFRTGRRIPYLVEAECQVEFPVEVNEDGLIRPIITPRIERGTIPNYAKIEGWQKPIDYLIRSLAEIYAMREVHGLVCLDISAINKGFDLLHGQPIKLDETDEYPREVYSINGTAYIRMPA